MSDTKNGSPTEIVTQELIHDLLKERRSERRWRNLRFFAGFLLVVYSAFTVLNPNKSPSVSGNGDGGYVALVHMDGLIAAGESFSASEVVPLLREAFADTQAKGVILAINSGGGTPVQASLIHDEILQLKNKYHKKVIVVGEDMLASGAYFVAVSGDKIYVNPNTVTGSIGVIMQGFGLTDAMKKFGVERRVYASGAHKNRLDAFLAQSPQDVAKIQSVIDEVHENFNQVVLQSRRGKLHGDVKELFSGDFWTGQSALKLGLVDQLGSVSDAMQKEFHVTKCKDYSSSGNFLKSLASQVSSVLNLPLHAQQQGLWSTF